MENVPDHMLSEAPKLPDNVYVSLHMPGNVHVTTNEREGLMRGEPPVIGVVQGSPGKVTHSVVPLSLKDQVVKEKFTPHPNGGTHAHMLATVGPE